MGHRWACKARFHPSNPRELLPTPPAHTDVPSLKSPGLLCQGDCWGLTQLWSSDYLLKIHHILHAGCVPGTTEDLRRTRKLKLLCH